LYICLWKKIDFRTVDSKTRTAIRKRALQQIQQGVKKKVVALNYGVNVNTITSWVKRYDSKGSKGLVDNKRGVKSEEKKLLSSGQEKDVQKMILDTMPDQLKLPYSLWTRKAVMELIEREFGVNNPRGKPTRH